MHILDHVFVFDNTDMVISVLYIFIKVCCLIMLILGVLLLGYTHCSDMVRKHAPLIQCFNSIWLPANPPSKNK